MYSKKKSVNSLVSFNKDFDLFRKSALRKTLTLFLSL